MAGESGITIGVKKKPSPFPCSPVIRESSWKKTQIEKKKKKLELPGLESSWPLHGRKVPWYSVFLFFIFFRSSDMKEHLDENEFRHCYGNYFKNAVLKVTWFQLYSNFFLNNYEAHWRQHLKDTLRFKDLRLKILRTWINIHANSILGKYHEMKMGEGDLEIISFTKIWACSLKNIASVHFTFYCIVLCLSNKPGV